MSGSNTGHRNVASAPSRCVASPPMPLQFGPASLCWTSPSPPWTIQSRRRSSICCWTCSERWGGPISSFRTTCPLCGMFPPGSPSCISVQFARWARQAESSPNHGTIIRGLESVPCRTYRPAAGVSRLCRAIRPTPSIRQKAAPFISPVRRRRRYAGSKTALAGNCPGQACACHFPADR